MVRNLEAELTLLDQTSAGTPSGRALRISRRFGRSVKQQPASVPTLGVLSAGGLT